MKLPLQILLFFLLAQLFGVYTGWVLHRDILFNPYVQSMVITQDADAPENAGYFFLYILVGAVFMVVLIRFFSSFAWVFRAMEFFIIASSSSVVFYALLRLALAYADAMALAILLGLALSAAKMVKPLLKNPAAILATAGVGSIFGISLGVLPAIAFLLLLAIYDYVAVFITKHMVEMATFMIKQDLAFTVTARGLLPATEKGKPPEEKRIDLGTGDLIAPVMLEVAVLPLGFVAVGMVFTGSLLAFGIFIFMVWKKRMVLPALPPIVGGSVLFFFVGKLLGLY